MTMTHTQLDNINLINTDNIPNRIYYENSDLFLNLFRAHDINRHLFLPYCNTIIDVINYIDSRKKLEGKRCWFAFCRDQPIGITYTYGESCSFRRAYLGMGIAPEYRGAGALVYAAFCDILRQDGITKGIAEIEPDNKASLRLAEKLGFTREGYMRDSYYVESLGKYIDYVLYDVNIIR